jgi:8-oxo-dGTP diphosphatase
MADLGQARRSTFLDAFWRTAYRVGFPLARIWWRLRNQQHEGALVAIYVGQALLLLRSSYRNAWNFPGGSVRDGETPEVAARRELGEEIGLTGTFPLVAAGDAQGVWDGRQDKVHFFELRLDRLPDLQLDNREIIAARLISPSELRGMALTGPVAVYLGRTIPSGRHSE